MKGFGQNNQTEITEAMVRDLARTNGLEILDEDLLEVTHRFRAMLSAAKSIEGLDLEGIQPAPVIAERELAR